MRRSAALLGCVLLSWAARASAQIHREGLIRELAAPVAPTALKNRGDGVLWQARIDSSGSLWVRLHFADIASPPGADFRVVVRDRSERAIARYPAATFVAGREFLSDVLFSPSVTVQLEGPKADGVTFKIDRLVYEVDPIGRFAPQSIVANWRTVDEAATKMKKPQLGDYARSIAKLYIGDGFVCTGFLVSSSLVLTNYHCLKESVTFQQSAGASLDKRQCGDVDFQFDFNQQGSAALSPQTRCIGIRDFDERLDFALLMLRPDAVAVNKAPRPSLKLARLNDMYKGSVFIIHHPAGLATQVSFDCQAFAGTLDNRPVVEHDCATIGGSSGSPVMNGDGEVVALHFAGPFPDEWTMLDVQRALASGRVFRNKARDMRDLQDRLARAMGGTS